MTGVWIKNNKNVECNIYVYHSKEFFEYFSNTQTMRMDSIDTKKKKECCTPVTKEEEAFILFFSITILSLCRVLSSAFNVSLTHNCYIPPFFSAAYLNLEENMNQIKCKN